jgi:RNA polymerase sigma-70 factor (ECF subfamily)
MAESVNNAFVQQINENLDIARKVSRIYFPDVHDREDVLQEMMYQLWRSYKSFDGRSKFSTWMYRVCLNTALTYRRNRRKIEGALTEFHENIPEPNPVNNEETFNLLFKAIGTLSAVNKAIVLLYLEDMSYEEIASITGLTKSNVSVRLVRIKKELETLLRREI